MLSSSNQFFWIDDSEGAIVDFSGINLTFSNTSLADLGLTETTYVYTSSQGGSPATITVDFVDNNPGNNVPEPTGAMLLGLGALTLCLRKNRK